MIKPRKHQHLAKAYLEVFWCFWVALQCTTGTKVVLRPPTEQYNIWTNITSKQQQQEEEQEGKQEEEEEEPQQQPQPQHMD